MIQDVPKIGRVYQLNPGSVSPTRPAGRDANGIPREETICALAKSEHFIDPSGNECVVPLQCGRVLSQEPEAERIELQQRKDQIRAGSLPLNECPHTTKYSDWVGEADGGALVPPPPGVVACVGAKRPADWPAGKRFYGCEHMKPVIAARLERAHKTWLAQQQAAERPMSPEQVLALGRQMGEGFASAMPGLAARQRLAEGKGEK